MQDQHGSMVHRKLAEAALQLITIKDGPEVIGSAWFPAGVGFDRRHPARGVSVFGVARSQEQPVRPGIETIRVTQPGQIAPDIEQGTLHSVLGQLAVPKQTHGNADIAVERRVHDLRIRVPITLLCPDDRLAVHTLPQATGIAP